MAITINEQLKKTMQTSMERVQNRDPMQRAALKNSLAQNAAKPVGQIGQKSSKTYKQLSTAPAGKSTQRVNTGWQYKADGTKKSFSELTTPEVLTWISTLPEEERAGAAKDFETNYLKNPGSTRYDPYYTDYSNNDSARSLFGVNTFDQKWIDANRGYANYLTFTAENYTTPKKPGNNASAEEKAAYEWWQIANTYEQTTQAAEAEYAQLRAEIQEMTQVARKAGDNLTADEIMAGIDWGEYKTLKNLREASAAGNGRYLNRPVQVGDASIKSMINAALRGENVTDARDFLYDESKYLQSSAAKRPMLQMKSAPEKAYDTYADAASAQYDPYHGSGSNNAAAKEMFGVDSFDQEWIDANRGLMSYVKFKDEDDTTPIKPDDKASEQEKKAYQYWLIANTYEQTTKNAEKEAEELQKWLNRKAERMGEGTTPEQLLAKIDWEDSDWQKEYPTISNMREVAAAGNARMLNRAVNIGNDGLTAMAKKALGITGEEEAEEAPETQTEETAKQEPQAIAETEVAAVNKTQEDASEKPLTERRNAQTEKEIQQLQTRMGGLKRAIEIGRISDEQRAEYETEIADIERRLYGDRAQEPQAPAETNAPAPMTTSIPQATMPTNTPQEPQAIAGPAKQTEPTKSAAPKTAAELVDENRQEYGTTAAASMLKQTISFLNDMDAQGKLTDEQRAQRDEWQAEYDRLMDEQAERDAIEERVRDDFLTADFSQMNPVKWISDGLFLDALRDAEFVPTEDYEDYLRYRRNAANFSEERQAELAKYNVLGPWQERLSLLVEGVATGMDKAAMAQTSGLEYVLYTLARWDPATKGMTKDEIYASDRFLSSLKGWNAQFDREYIPEETKAELAQEYPVMSLISTGVSELLKMTGQATGMLPYDPTRIANVSTQYGLAALQNGGKATQVIGRLGEKAVKTMPFALDVYASTYETAITEGATEDQAAAAAALNGLFTGTLSSFVVGRLGKMGGNITRLFQSRAGQKAVQQGTIAAAKNGTLNAILSVGRNFLKSAVEEGLEEAVEVPIEGLIAKGIYDRDRAWTGEGGIFDAKAMAQSGIGGAVAGSMFTMTAGASGLMGKASQTEADRLIEKAANGGEVTKEEIENLEKIEAREAAIQDKAEEIMAADTSAIDAAEQQVEAAQEKAQEADEQLAQAQEKKEAAMQAAKPVLDEMNNGTASYQDPEIQKAISEARDQMAAAKEATDESQSVADKARAELEEMKAARDQTLQQAETQARAQATAEVENEIRQEEEAKTQAAAEAKKAEAERPATPGVRFMNKRHAQLTAAQQGQFNILDRLGKKYGIEIDVVDTLGNGAQGAYAGGRRITVALDATENAYVQVGVHEMVHYIKEQSADSYEILKGAVLDRLAEDGFELDDEVEKRIRQYEGVQQISREEAIDEIVAEAVPAVFTDEDAMRMLAERDRTLVEKIRDRIVEFSRTLWEIAQNYVDRMGRTEIAMLSSNREALLEIADVLDLALEEAKGAESGSERTESKYSAGASVDKTDTEAFRKWFGSSKIVNEDGSPKVMYHGSTASFTEFDKRKAKSSGLYGRGFYFTNSDSHAGQYGNLYQVYLKVDNPLTPDGSTVTKTQVRKFLEAVADNEDDYSIENYGTYDVNEILKNVYQKDAFTVIQDVNATAIGDFVEAVKLFNEVNGTKYDGIVVPTETVVFDPTQIKSATDNIGTFDPENPDIRYSVGAKTDGDAAALVERTRTEEKAQTMSDATRLANRVKREYRSEMDKADIAAGVDAIIDAYYEHDEKAAADAADKIAREIVESSVRTDVSHREGYEEIRKRLRETGFSLTDTQKQEVANRKGSYNDWRKSVMGSVKAKNDAPSLDSIWGQLSEAAPEYFPADANEAQMPEYIEQFVQAMKPRYENPYGMDVNTAAADLSMRLQADVSRLMGSDGETRAQQLTAASESLRADAQARTEKQRAEKQQKRQEEFKRITDQVREAKNSGNDETLKKAMADYRKLMGGRSKTADAVDAGIEARKMRREAERLTGMINQLTEMIEGEDADQSRQKLIDERKSYTELRDVMQKKAAALHRQEVIDRIATDPEEEIELWEIGAKEELDERMNEDMDYTITRNVEDMRERTEALYERMREKQADFNMTSTMNFEDAAEMFADLEEDIVRHSELAEVWKGRSETLQDMKKETSDLLSALRRDLRNAQDSGDIAAENTANGLIVETEDQINVLNSQLNLARAQEQYCRRIGAQSLEQALKGGRLPEPIMEKIIAMVKDSGRRGKFNNNVIVQAFETERLSTTTVARVWDDIFGDYAPVMRAIYYDQVMDNETARQVWIKNWRERLGALNLTHEESMQVQKIGEGRMAYDEATGDVSDKVRGAVLVFRQFYEEAYAMAKDALVRNGYKQPGYISDYFPHLDIPQTFLEKLGIPVEHAALPTSINGLTETFRPGKQYSGHLQTRKGETTDYDALLGFEEYIATISNVIYHTDDIQRIRQLETEIRATAANSIEWPDRDVHGQSFFANHFVSWLNEYGNLLAGKKSSIDRGAEKVLLGRVVYASANKLKALKGANAVMGNMASAVTNVVPVTQIVAEEPVATLKAAAQMLTEMVKGRGNRPESQFLIRRHGSDSINKTVYSRFSKFVSIPFERVDMFASNLVVNAYYQHNLDLGMDSETAMRSADSKAARLMGDRSKGAMPNMYGSQTLSFFTQFQYEVANQSQHFRKDIWREQGLGKGLITMFATAMTGYLFNELSEMITGRRSAADPIQLVIDVWETSMEGDGAMPVVQAVYNNVSEMFPYMGGGRIAAFEGITDLLTAVFTEGNDGSDVAYAAKNLGIGLIPMGGQIKKTVRGAVATNFLGVNTGLSKLEEFTKGFIDVNPAGGYYSANGKRLYYPIDTTNPLAIAQALVFGPSATEYGRSYYEGDTKALTETQTRNYEQARERGATSVEAYENEAARAAAASLEDKASETLNAAEEAEMQKEAEGEGPTVDTSNVESQKAEAAQLRSETMPGDKLTDYWWERRDTPEVQAAIAIWQKTGKDWALPYAYSADKIYSVDGEKKMLGSKLVKEAEEMYEEGYMEIMSGVDPEQMDEEELEALESELEDLRAEVNSAMKKRIKERNKELE